jgi:uncharacterized protein YegP (UPF0339 family)
MSGKFEIYQSEKNQEYYFRLKASNGENILSSQGYNQKNGAQTGIESVVTNSPDPDNFEKITAANGTYYFNLKANNGQVIGTSQMYKSASGRNNGIEAVGRAAQDAVIEDLSK